MQLQGRTYSLSIQKLCCYTPCNSPCL